MSIYDFAKIKNSKELEKLTLDLLEAEGFYISSQSAHAGVESNIIAEEIIISHSGFSQTLRWCVCCTHSRERFLSVRKIKQVLDDYDNCADDGLLLVTDTDISEEALSMLEAYIDRNSPENTSNSEANRKQLIKLRQILETRFSDGELRTLCFDLGVDYEGLPGEGKNSKARELISYLERRNNIDALLETGKKLRPDVPWRSKPEPRQADRQNNRQRKLLIQVWDQRQLENRLMRHPIIAQKYNIAKDTESTLPFNNAGIKDKSILIISDTSPFAYQLFSSLNKVNANVQIVSVWQYEDPVRCQLLLKDILNVSHDLVIFFLGDTFGFPIPNMILEKLLKTESAGKGIIFFPFFAWALHQGNYQVIDKLVPVKLADQPRVDQLWLKAARILASHDFTWLNAEAFIENQSVTIKVDNRHPILNGVESDFNIIHSFEFLTLKEKANCILTDNVGTPFLVINEATDAPVVYINSCTHNCLSKTPILSPFEVSEHFQKLIVNSVLWCLGLIS